MEAATSAIGTIMVMLAIVAVAALIGLKPETFRGVIRWALLAAAVLTIAAVAVELLLVQQPTSLLAILVAFLLIAGFLLLFAAAIRAVVDRIARVRNAAR